MPTLHSEEVAGAADTSGREQQLLLAERIMTVQAWIMLGILAAMFALLVWGRFPNWLVFMGTLTACLTFRLAPHAALLKGFSNSGVLTVAALFPVAAGMFSTGAISLVTKRVFGRPKTLGAAEIKILPPIAIASSFLNNTPMVAMMIPAIRDLSRTTGLAPSKLFMGVSFASILGGTMTLIGTSVNLIISGLTIDAIDSGKLHGVKPLSLFFPFWVGLPVTVAGVLYMILIGTRLLPGAKQREAASGTSRLFRAEFRVEPEADLDGKTLEEAEFWQPSDYRLLSVTRKGEDMTITADLRLQGEDLLAMAGPADAVAGLWAVIDDPRLRKSAAKPTVSRPTGGSRGFAGDARRGAPRVRGSTAGQPLCDQDGWCIARRPCARGAASRVSRAARRRRGARGPRIVFLREPARVRFHPDQSRGGLRGEARGPRHLRPCNHGRHDGAGGLQPDDDADRRAARDGRHVGNRLPHSSAHLETAWKGQP